MDAGAALAQAPSGEYRGVRVLEADPEPTPPKPVTALTAPVPPPTPVDAVKPPREKPPARVLKFCARPFATPDLTLGVTRDFDQALSHALAGDKAVVVDLAEPFADHAAPPAALTPWLSEVRAAGGQVTVTQYCDAARGALGSWVAGIFGHRGSGLYRVARRYNAVLHADALDRVITQVEFAPKPRGPV